MNQLQPGQPRYFSAALASEGVAFAEAVYAYALGWLQARAPARTDAAPWLAYRVELVEMLSDALTGQDGTEPVRSLPETLSIVGKFLEDLWDNPDWHLESALAEMADPAERLMERERLFQLSQRQYLSCE